MIKIGMPILYEYETLEENFLLAQKLGFDFVELNLNFGYCRKEMEEGNVSSLLDKYHLEATLHFYDEADLASYDEVVSAYLSLLEKYAKLGKDYIKIINLHNNYGPVVTISGNKNYIYQKEYDDYIKRLVDNFKKAEKIINENGMKMVIENVDGVSKNAKTDFLSQSFRKLNEEGFHFNYDIGHDNLDNNRIYNLIQNKDFIFDEFHFHDSDGSRCHLALGSGSLDLKYYYNLAMKNNSYLLIEVKSSEDLKVSIDYLNKIK